MQIAFYARRRKPDSCVVFTLVRLSLSPSVDNYRVRHLAIYDWYQSVTHEPVRELTNRVKLGPANRFRTFVILFAYIWESRSCNYITLSLRFPRTRSLLAVTRNKVQRNRKKLHRKICTERIYYSFLHTNSFQFFVLLLVVQELTVTLREKNSWCYWDYSHSTIFFYWSNKK